MARVFQFDAKQAPTARTLEGFRVGSGLVVGILFAICTGLLLAYKINKRMTIQMADELAERRRKIAAA